jgi:hypothetical protein
MAEIKRIQDEPTETRTTNALLGLQAAGVVAPIVAPYVQKGIDKLTGPKDDGPKTILPPGVHPDG